MTAPDAPGPSVPPAADPPAADAPAAGQADARPWWYPLPFVLCALVFLVHLGVILHHAVDVPFRDEWELLRPNGLPAGLSLSWLWEQQNEHRIPLVRLQVWALYHLNSWHQPTHQALAFLVYGGLVALVAAHTVRLGLSAWTAAWFAIPLLSPINWENHGYGLQVMVALTVLGPVLTAWGLFDPRPGLKPRLLGLVGIAVAIGSFTWGVVWSLAVLVLWVVVRADSRTPAGRRELGLVAGIALLAFAAWAYGWQRHAGADPTPPWSGAFWAFALNLISLGFGFQTVSSALGALCLTAVVAPAVILVLRQGREAPWSAIALLFGLGVVIAATAYGRAHWGPGYAKASRYSGVTLYLIPYTAVLWRAVWIHATTPAPAAPSTPAPAAPSTPARASLAAVWLLAAFGLADDWSSQGYRELEQVKLRGLALTQAYARGDVTPPVRMPVFFHGRDLAPLVDEAYRLELSFTRDD